MLLNRLEKALMNNPVRAAVQRRFEVPRLLAMGGRMQGGVALEIGCGRGIGTELLLELCGADRVEAFDLDPDMVALAQARLAHAGDRVRLWQGDVTAIAAPAGHYDAVWDFAIVHHVPDWRAALHEVWRVLRPGGRFYVEEVLAHFIGHPVWRRLLDHPQRDRFDRASLETGLVSAGFQVVASKQLWNDFAWVVAEKPR